MKRWTPVNESPPPSPTSASTPRGATRRGAKPWAFLVLAAAGLWIITSWLVVSPAERCYLIVPWWYAGTTAIAWRRNGWRGARWRILTVGIGAALFAGMLLADRLAPSQALQPYERSMIVYGLLAVLVVASWLWGLLEWLAGKLFGVNTPPGSPAKTSLRKLSVRIGTLVVYAVLLDAYLLAILETHWPRRLEPATPAQLRLDYQRVAWKSRDGTPLVGWWVPAERSDRTAIVCHGVGAYKADMLEFIYTLNDGGFNVFALDFRSHGESGGHTVTYGRLEKQDILSALDVVREKYPAGSQRLVGVGWSMGAASLILAAAEDERLEALHIDAAFARTFSIARVIARQQPPIVRGICLYMGTAWGSLEAQTNLFTLAPVEMIGRIAPRPIMLIHGDVDQVIPIDEGRMLFAAAGEPKYWHVVVGAGHCQTLALETPIYGQRMIRFLKDALREEIRVAQPQPQPQHQHQHHEANPETQSQESDWHADH